MLKTTFLCLVALPLFAQKQPLPDPLLLNNGKRITTANQWRTQRRPELLERFANEMYGHSPGRPSTMRFEVFDTDTKALGGKATRKQVAVYFNGKSDGPRMDVLLYIPNQVKGPVPAIVGLNFWGNQSINADPGIRVSTSWMESGRGNPYIDVSCVVNHRSTEGCRGINARQWPVDSILSRGYALVTAYREDIASDEKSTMFTTGVQPLYPEFQNRGDNFGTVAAWAWGLSRIMDYIQTDKRIDPNRVAVFGWSRLGKAALWAGATDERFALVISHESGAGGAKLFHRGVGENIRRLCTVFPHWFAGNFKKYMDQDTLLPFDQHMVISLVAPRPIYVASAEQDKGSDPEGEFEGAKSASSVYQFLGTQGLPTSTMPPLNQSVQGQIGYHIRPGGHDVTNFDWTQYLAFLDKHIKKK
ncbi:acetylxylan esterase [Spirosoma sp. HMF3257]|uniref:Acetylxylan esterase n=1 Tax=Spirosoma telluris TaxID=2183553 RepID=A0A327NRS5_9BACT|nr:acetylxylan esterase [Spirosoma telluris]RAI78050.1 acetylxylan esterase [Spirosoma telluris]